MEVEHSDAACYFTEKEWGEFCHYEKVRYENTLTIFIEMIKRGFEMEVPKFITEYEERFKNGIKSSKNEKNNVSSYLERETFISRYPKRNIKVKNYHEEENLDDDSYIYCDICLNEFIDGCKKHPLIHIKDNPVPLRPKNRERARLTIPPQCLLIKKSSIPNAGEGVWSLTKLRMGLKFGPYEGISTYNFNGGCYSWEIKKNGKVIKFIDGQNETKSNWMRYVNCARNNSEQNLMAFLYHGQIYYRTVREIPANSEILVYYGNQFAKLLGIDVKLYHSVPEDSGIYCDLAFKSNDYQETHVKRCLRCFQLIYNVEKNSVICESNVDYKCHLCENIYIIKKNLNSNLKRNHNIYEQLAASSSKSDTEIDDNIKKETNKDDNNNESIRHKRSNDDDKYLYTCNICTQIFRRLGSLESHNVKRQFSCEICKKTFVQSRSLPTHKRVHTGERSYICHICNKSFVYSSSLISHKKKHTGDRSFIFDICNKTFVYSSNLISHKRMHTGERPFMCNSYKKTFVQSCHLQTHKLKHTGERSFICDICNKTFVYSRNLTRHKRIHTGERPFMQNMYKKTFVHSGQLLIHNRIHSCEHPVMCKICDKRFTDSSSLSSHMRIHNGERLFICDICNDTFAYSVSLKVHKFKHSGEKPFACNICDKSYAYSSSLNRHKKIHTSERPFICNKRFTYSSNFLNFKNIHMEEQRNTFWLK